MTTTELIKILQDNEKGGISHKPRNISLYINGRYMSNPQISLSSTGDGICGPEIDLDIEGEWFEQQPNRCDSCTHSEEQDGSNCYECVKGMADNFEAQPCEEDIHREREQAYMLGYEDASKRFRTQPCEDCTSKEAVIKNIKWWFDKVELNPDILIDSIITLPSVTPQKAKGKWVEIEIDAGEFIYKCTKCGMRVINPYKYCPICGSYNGGGEDEAND